MQDRLTEIEIKLAHLEQSLNDLNDVMVKHSDLIDRLNLRCEQISGQLDLMDAGPTGTQEGVEKPPHY